MKHRQFETVLILLFTGALLALYSYFNPSLSFKMLKGEDVDLGFIPFDKMLTFSYTNTENAKADSLTDKLLDKSNQDSASVSNKNKEVVAEATPYFSSSNTKGIGALDDFFSAINFEAPKKLVRIAHYGDSQIEGDRITCNLRNKFTQEFGGEGVGFVPFEDIAECVTYTRNASKNWKRFTVFRDKLKNGAFGLSGMSFIYNKGDQPIVADSAGEMESEDIPKSKEGATISLRLRNKYSKLLIQYGNATSPCKVVVRKNGSETILGSATLSSNDLFVEQEIELSAYEKNITISFSGSSPMIYGISFDGDKGVQVDNFGIRGHSGNGLLKIEKSLLAKEISVSNTRLVILQFGANTIPYVNGEKTLNYVSQEFKKLFKKFKQANQHISILVIGVGDMATRINGEYTSYPMIPNIRDVLKKAALDEGCAYFDLYEYMGGKDAILSWSKKGLASKDGHFSPKGQQIVADEIFTTINNQYHLFKKKYHISK
jgi:lysophospholipase L1-like esterase